MFYYFTFLHCVFIVSFLSCFKLFCFFACTAFWPTAVVFKSSINKLDLTCLDSRRACGWLWHCARMHLCVCCVRGCRKTLWGKGWGKHRCVRVCLLSGWHWQCLLQVPMSCEWQPTTQMMTPQRTGSSSTASSRRCRTTPRTCSPSTGRQETSSPWQQAWTERSVPWQPQKAECHHVHHMRRKEGCQYWTWAGKGYSCS